MDDRTPLDRSEHCSGLGDWCGGQIITYVYNLGEKQVLDCFLPEIVKKWLN